MNKSHNFFHTFFHICRKSFIYPFHSTFQQTQGKLNPFTHSLNYLNFFYQRLIHHYSHHSDEEPPMIKVSEFLHSLNTKQFCIKIQVQREDFANINYTFGNHIHFDNDSIRTTLCQFSDKDCLFIIEGKTESGHEVKLFWGEKHFELLKQINIFYLQIGFPETSPLHGNIIIYQLNIRLTTNEIWITNLGAQTHPPEQALIPVVILAPPFIPHPPPGPGSGA